MSEQTFDAEALQSEAEADFLDNAPGAAQMGVEDLADDVTDAAAHPDGVIPSDEFTYDPTAPTVAGTPSVDGEFWLFQGYAGTCGATSVAMVLSDVMGVPLESNQQVVDRAVELGVIGFDPNEAADTGDGWSGMSSHGMEVLLEDYGIEAETRNGDLDSLEADLEAGRPVIVTVDSDEVLYNESDLLSLDAGMDSNHAAVVTGMDRTNGWVSLNNPNDPSGATVVVPLSQFEDAWADSGNQMIVATLPAGGGVPEQIRALDVREAGEDPGEPAQTPGGPGGAGGATSTEGDNTVTWLPFELVVRTLEQIF